MVSIAENFRTSAIDSDICPASCPTESYLLGPGLPYYDFGTYVCTMMVLGPVGCIYAPKNPCRRWRLLTVASEERPMVSDAALYTQNVDYLADTEQSSPKHTCVYTSLKLQVDNQVE